MEILHVWDDPDSITNGHTSQSIEDYKDRKPLIMSGYYLTGYHNNPIKVGETAKLIFNSAPVTDGKDLRCDIVRITAIRFQFWNGDNDPNTNPELGKYILQETIPAYKNWVQVQFISEEREQKLNQLIDGKS